MHVRWRSVEATLLLDVEDGEHDAIKDMLPARCLNGGGRYMLHNGVEVRDGSLKAIEQLIGYGLNAAFGNHHRAVGHCTPSEVGESKTLRKGGVERDTCKKRFEDTFCGWAKTPGAQALCNGRRGCIHRALKIVGRGAQSPFEKSKAVAKANGFEGWKQVLRRAKRIAQQPSPAR